MGKLRDNFKRASRPEEAGYKVYGERRAGRRISYGNYGRFRQQDLPDGERHPVESVEGVEGIHDKF